MKTADPAPLAMGAVADARARMLTYARPLPEEQVPLALAAGRVLAAPVRARRDQPPFAASAMDGYAVRAADTPGALNVVGESAAGARYTDKLRAGACVRIFTGAPLPGGADAIVPQEAVTRNGDCAIVPAAPSGAFVRDAALDFCAGDELLPAGATLSGVALSFAAAAGHGTLSVRARPRVALLATGDELVPPGADPTPDQIFDAVSFGLAALIENWGGEAVTIPTKGDDKAAIAAAAQSAAQVRADLLVTIGGASVGDYDLVKPALEAFGLKLAVDRVNLRPGKPTWFGVTEIGNVLGLPGNPASALVCAHLFLKPLMDAMLARTQRSPWVRAGLVGPLPQNEAREHYLRSFLSVDENGRANVQPFEAQDSSLLSVFNGANALVRSMPNAPAQQAGALVDVLDLAAV